MKRWISPVAGLGVLALSGSAQVVLPEAAPGPFAPVAARIAGPELPAKPLETKPPSIKDCRNSSAVLKALQVKLTDKQEQALETQRFLLLPIHGQSPRLRPTD